MQAVAIGLLDMPHLGDVQDWSLNTLCRGSDHQKSANSTQWLFAILMCGYPEAYNATELAANQVRCRRKQACGIGFFPPPPVLACPGETAMLHGDLVQEDHRP